MLMKKVIWWLSSVFTPKGFSDFAYLGDLRKFSLPEMQLKLHGRWTQEVTFYTTYQEVKWSDKDSSYSIYYTLNGDFIQIKEEVWKKEKEISIRPLRTDFEFN
jgi:hypothetical protein